MVQTRTTAAITALLAVLGLGGCASFCGAPAGGPPPPPAPPQAQRGPPPHDSDFDAALQACATVQGIAWAAPDASSLGPPSPALLQCLQAQGFGPPPRHG
ncbi:hypothetical protein [Xanthomonas euroxanthea]|uniref:hypothetical protein n=1 Tax=Xanthomonas euroxanthea TaxID=2259622 RepID=UPI0016126B3F|nr:hypothetical protein [Xanthomonas euroxanthea]MBB5766893.1 hypothetical protein [Xanthomonas euroxanthea]